MDPREAHHIIDHLLSSSSEQKQIFLHKLLEVERQGFAVSYGEKTEGTASVAAPIIGFNNKVIGALSVGVLSHRINDDRLTFLINKVKQAASEISTKIGRTSVV